MQSDQVSRKDAIWDRVAAIYVELESLREKAARARLVSELHALFREADAITIRNVKEGK